MGPMLTISLLKKKVLLGGDLNFCKTLAMWFCLHYIFNLEYASLRAGFIFSRICVWASCLKSKKTQLSSQFQVTFSHLLYLKFYNQLCCMEPFFVFNDSPFHYHACSGTADIALDN